MKVLASEGKLGYSKLVSLGDITMQEKVLDFIKDKHMFDPGDRILIAVSGGADSVCLLSLLCRFQKQLGLAALFAIHIHHGLRGEEADRDADYVRTFCAVLGVSCVVRYYDVAAYARTYRCSLEEAGRILRYQAFALEAEKHKVNKIAVAHHRDDEAETIIHHLLRGSGLKGLAGIVPIRDSIVRPLLCVGRSEIEAYLTEHGIACCLDSTNTTDDYTRNKIRHRILPLVQEINDQAVDNIRRAGQLIRSADEYLESQAAKLFRQSVICEENEEIKSASIPAAVLVSQPEIIRTYIIRQMVRYCSESMRDITARHIFQIEELLEKSTGSHTDLPDQLAAERVYETIRVFWEKRTERDREDTAPVLHFRIIPAKNRQQIPKNQYTKWFDYDKIQGTLSVRTRKTGDYLAINSGKHKSLKAFFVDEKVPRNQRGHILLLAEENHVIWIVGYRISEYYKITSETKLILEVTIDGGEDHGRQD